MTGAPGGTRSWSERSPHPPASGWGYGASPRLDRADVPRASPRHLPDRPGRADRPGAGRRRRPRAAAVYERASRSWGWTGRSGSSSSSIWRSLAGDFGMSVLTSQPVLATSSASSRRPSSSRPSRRSSASCSACPPGVLAAARRGRLADHLVRIIGLFGYSVPIFWLGLVGLLLFYGKLGWVSGPGRLDVFFQGIVTPRHRHHPARLRPGRRVGYLRQCLQPPDPAGDACSAIFRSPISRA